MCDRHGRYTAGCGDCQARARTRRRGLTRAVAYGLYLPGRQTAEEARAHITDLHDNHDMSYRQIAAAARVRHDAVTNIAAGTQQSGLRRTIAAILNVTPAAPTTYGRVPAVGGARRLQGLAAACYSAADLAPHLDTDVQCVRRWRLHFTPTISLRRHNDIADLAARLEHIPGPSPHARNQAATEGWLPLAAWDDIDNPDARPYTPTGDDTVVDLERIRRALAGTRMELTPLEMHHAVHYGIDQGIAVTTIAELLHINHKRAKTLSSQPLPDHYALAA
jgi:hypothetical protein